MEAAMLAAGVDRILIINTVLVSLPGKSTSRAIRFFSRLPGKIGRGAREQQAVMDALGRGAFSVVRWTLVRAGFNAPRAGTRFRPLQWIGLARGTPGCRFRIMPWHVG